MGDPRTLYLDLMEKVITNTIYGDPDQAPWGKGTFDPEKRESGLDWPTVAHSMIGAKRLGNLRTLCERAFTEGVPGDFIETGVWRGGACILMRAVIAAYGDAARKVICADSFAGLPPPSPDAYPADLNDRHHEFDQLAIPLEQVQDNFRRYELLDEQVVFLKGLFKDTLPGLSAERFAVIRCDGDMYESTIQALEALYPRLSPGGFLIIDDYGAIPACRAAVEDYRTQNGIDAEKHQVDWTGIWWQKPAEAKA